MTKQILMPIEEYNKEKTETYDNGFNKCASIVKDILTTGGAGVTIDETKASIELINFINFTKDIYGQLPTKS